MRKKVEKKKDEKKRFQKYVKHPQNKSNTAVVKIVQYLLINEQLFDNNTHFIYHLL